MKPYETKDIRNVGIVGHGHCGKTSVVAGLLYAAGATTRLTRVDEGNTVTDFDEEEINRKLTISSSVAAIEWKKTKINFIDTPGFNMFVAKEAHKRGLPVFFYIAPQVWAWGKGRAKKWSWLSC